MGIQRNIDPKVLTDLQEVYLREYHQNPNKLVKALNEKFSDYIDKYKDGSGSIVSSRTLRNFFNANEPTLNATTLNFLTQLMLGDEYESIARAPHQDFTLEPLFTKYRDKTRARVKYAILLDYNHSCELDEIYTGTYFTDLQQSKNRDYVKSLKRIISEDKLNLKFQENNNHVIGLEEVKKHPRLFLVGRPGIGKTIFCKKVTQIYLDVETCIQDFGKEIIPIYLPLKVCSEEILLEGLKEYIINDFYTTSEPSKRNISSQVMSLLNNGQALIILDALDETGDKFKRICFVIESFINNFPNCRIIITSRLSTEYPNFPGFKQWQVELLNNEQSQNLIRNLFLKDLESSSQKYPLQENLQQIDKLVGDFFEKLPEGAAEFRSHPLSLIYLGILYLENYGLLKPISEIYQDVVDIFLRRWDRARYIRDRIPLTHNKLTKSQKRNFFSELAFDGFKKSITVWKEKTLKQLLAEYLKKLSSISQDEIDTHVEFLLKVFVMDDGLLVPANRGYYSFSFAYLQDYFSARYLIANENSSYINKFLHENLLDSKWENVLIMYSELLPKADYFFRCIYDNIRKKFIGNRKLDRILCSLQKAAKECNLDTTSWRAQMLMLDNPLDLLISRQTPLPNDDLIGISKLTKKFNEQRRKTKENQTRFVIALYLAVAYALVQDKYLNRDSHHLTLKQSHPVILKTLIVSEKTGIEEEMQLALQEAEDAKEERLVYYLSQLKADLPSENSNVAEWKDWSKTLIDFMQKHLSCGVGIELNSKEKDIIKGYFYAVHLLLKCITGIYVADKEKTEDIFDHLLLPMDFTPML